jgi:GntR family transcriptional regulator
MARQTSDVLYWTTGMEARTGRLRRLGTRPLSEQAKEALLDSIGSGGFPDGTLPSEGRLAEELGVSRTTLREALQSLEEEGVVSRQHGVGTRVNQHVVRATPLSRVSGFYDLIRYAGHEPRIERTEIRDDVVRGEMAGRLERPEGTPLYQVERL